MLRRTSTHTVRATRVIMAALWKSKVRQDLTKELDWRSVLHYTALTETAGLRERLLGPSGAQPPTSERVVSLSGR